MFAFSDVDADHRPALASTGFPGWERLHFMEGSWD